MFDVGRAVILGWVLVRAWRARNAVSLMCVAVVAYLFALAVVSGITIRSEGPQEPFVALVLALVGPSAMPRGSLPDVPLAAFLVKHPAVVNVLAATGTGAVVQRLTGRLDSLPATSESAARLDRLRLSLVLLMTSEGICAATRLLPHVLEHDG